MHVRWYARLHHVIEDVLTLVKLKHIVHGYLNSPVACTLSGCTRFNIFAVPYIHGLMIPIDLKNSSAFLRQSMCLDHLNSRHLPFGMHILPAQYRYIDPQQQKMR